MSPSLSERKTAHRKQVSSKKKARQYRCRSQQCTSTTNNTQSRTTTHAARLSCVTIHRRLLHFAAYELDGSHSVNAAGRRLTSTPHLNTAGIHQREARLRICANKKSVPPPWVDDDAFDLLLTDGHHLANAILAHSITRGKGGESAANLQHDSGPPLSNEAAVFYKKHMSAHDRVRATPTTY